MPAFTSTGLHVMWMHKSYHSLLMSLSSSQTRDACMHCVMRLHQFQVSDSTVHPAACFIMLCLDLSRVTPVFTEHRSRKVGISTYHACIIKKFKYCSALYNSTRTQSPEGLEALAPVGLHTSPTAGPNGSPAICGPPPPRPCLKGKNGTIRSNEPIQFASYARPCLKG